MFELGEEAEHTLITSVKTMGGHAFEAKIVILASMDVGNHHRIIAVASRVMWWQFCGGRVNSEHTIIQFLLNILNVAVMLWFFYYLRWCAFLGWFIVCWCCWSGDIGLLMFQHAFGVDIGINGSLYSKVRVGKPEGFPLIMPFLDFAPHTVDVGDGDKFFLIAGIVPIPGHVAVNGFQEHHALHEFFQHAITWFRVNMKQKV